ncbi:MAG: MFS transporter [Planctomycetaceae bacterium]|nr:MFS transporter [Planctomycetaceae bacterium]
MAMTQGLASVSANRAQRPRSERIWSFVFLDIIALAMLVSVICHALYGALPLYVESIGGSAAFSGLLTAVFALAAGVGRVVTGVVVCRYGCRIVLILGGVLLAAANLVPLIFPGLGVLLAVRFFQGVGFSQISTGSANASAEVLPKSRLGEGMGYYGLGQSISTVIGPSLGYFLFHYGRKSTWGNDVIWYGMVLISLVLIVCAWVCRYSVRGDGEGESADGKECGKECGNFTVSAEMEKSSEEVFPDRAMAVESSESTMETVDTPRGVDPVFEQEIQTGEDCSKGVGDSDDSARVKVEKRNLDRDLVNGGESGSGRLGARILSNFFEAGALGMALVCGLFMFSCSFYSSFLMLFAERNGISNPQCFFLGTALAMFAVRLLGGKFGDKYPPLTVLLPTLFVGLLSFWGTIFAHSAPALFLTGTFYGISIGLGFPLLNTLAYRLTPSHRWHASTATFFLGCDIGWAAGSYAWGCVIDAFGFTAALLASGLLVGVTAGTAVKTLK